MQHREHQFRARDMNSLQIHGDTQDLSLTSLRKDSSSGFLYRPTYLHLEEETRGDRQHLSTICHRSSSACSFIPSFVRRSLACRQPTYVRHLTSEPHHRCCGLGRKAGLLFALARLAGEPGGEKARFAEPLSWSSSSTSPPPPPSFLSFNFLGSVWLGVKVEISTDALPRLSLAKRRFALKTSMLRIDFPVDGTFKVKELSVSQTGSTLP
mmetsp:Transcript_22370/g.33495  ORF Transcript_22370/g.33495 Transcript_22370/m.33495 type:complete len:210 (+) Transcript_22370:58-687(+)